MKVEVQGLFFLTVVCSLVSLLASSFLLLTCMITRLWKKSSYRLVMYLCLSNIWIALDLLMPSYRYEFFCTVQSHLLNFGIIMQFVLGALIMHFAYIKTVEERKLTRAMEIKYLGLAIIPALIDSLPPFFSQQVDNNCWGTKHSPLEEVAFSFSFLIPYSIGLIVMFAYGLGIISYLKLFPKGFYTEEYKKKLKTSQDIAGFTLMLYTSYFVVCLYSALLIIHSNAQAFAFIAMFCQASIGTFTMILFMRMEKTKIAMKEYLKSQGETVDLLREDQENFSSLMTERLSISD